MTEQDKQDEKPEQEATPAEGEAKAADASTAAAPAGGDRADRLAARAAAPAGPPTAVLESKGDSGVSRRGFLRIGFWSGFGAIMAAAAAVLVDMLYPRGVTGFGGVVSVDPGEVPAPGEKRGIQRGRFWLVNLTEEQGGPGILALWWKCPHLGCTVPWKENFIWPNEVGTPTKGWFRCPCHGSTYTDSGFRVFGPAPRSLDTMKVTVGSNGQISVDTGNITNGTPDNASRAVRL